MDRRAELDEIFKDCDENCKKMVIPMLDEVVFLEEKLKYLKGLPFLRVNPDNIGQQKATPASKQYKEYLQQYNNIIKTLTGVLKKGTDEEESPLRAFMRTFDEE